MHDINQPHSYRMTLALSVAILFHTAIVVSLFQLIPEIQREKTIPIQLVISSKATSEAAKTKTNKLSSTPEENAEDILNKERLQKAANEIITTTSSSSHWVSSQNSTTNNNDTQTTLQQSSKSIKQQNIFIPRVKTDLPDFRRDIAEASKNQAASKSFSDIASLFQQQEVVKASIVQVSSNTELPELSAYEKKLFARLTNAKFHDRMYSIISQLQSSKTLTLKLILFPNGALKNVIVVESSQLKTLDFAARQTALNASPFPKPPAADKAIGFRYQVSIRYDPITD